MINSNTLIMIAGPKPRVFVFQSCIDNYDIAHTEVSLSLAGRRHSKQLHRWVEYVTSGTCISLGPAGSGSIHRTSSSSSLTDEVCLCAASPSSLTDEVNLHSVQPAPHPREIKFTVCNQTLIPVRWKSPSVQPAPHPWVSKCIPCVTSPSSLRDENYQWATSPSSSLRDEVYLVHNQPLTPPEKWRSPSLQ